MHSKPTLAELRAYAQESIEMLDRQPIPDTDEARGCHAEILGAARELEARVGSPVTIGFVGEYNVGKSLLLGTLLGRPALLPVEDRPATGNITVLRLAQGPKGSRTQAAPTTEIRFLSQEQLAACIRTVLDDLVAVVEVQHPELRARALLGGYDPLTHPRGWALFDSWYPCLWGISRPGPPSVPGSPDIPAVPIELISAVHRDAVAELCRLRDAFLSQADLLGNQVTVGTDVVRAALALPTAKRTPDEPPKRRLHTLTAEGLRRPDVAVSQLQHSFPLIERVLLDVAVSPEHWLLEDLLAEHEVQILDFPGIGAAGSYGRDSYLSRRELVDVHTILLVLRTGRAEARGAAAFWEMLKKDGRPPEALQDAALVAANAFDMAHVPTLAGEGPLPLKECLERAHELNGIHTFAARFVGRHEQRIAAVSSVAGIDRLGLDHSDISLDTRERIDKALEALRAVPGPRWEPVAARLAAADPGNPWTPRLRAYDADGGIGALQKLIASHVGEHGTAQKLERARASERRLTQQLAALRREVHRADPGSGGEEYQELGRQLGELKRLVDRELNPGLELLRNPLLAPLPGEAVPPRIGDTAAAVRDEVYDWPEWRQLFERALNDPSHLVTRSEKRVQREARIERTPRPGRARDGAANAVPNDGSSSVDSSDAFIQKFVQLIDDRTAKDRNSLLDWLKEWGERWDGEFAPLRTWWLEEEADELLDELYTRRRGDADLADTQLTALWQALMAGENADETAVALEPPTEEARKQWAGNFPGLPAHGMPWHHRMPELNSHLEQQQRHPLGVSQLRVHTADAAARLATDYLDGLLAQVAEELGTRYQEASAFVLSEREITPPRTTAGALNGSGPEQPAEGEEGGRALQPVDVLIRKWSVSEA